MTISHSQLNDKLTHQKSLRQKEVVIIQGSMTDEVKRRKYCSLVDVSIILTNIEIRPSIQQIKLSMLYQLIIFVIRLSTYRVRWKASGFLLSDTGYCLSVSQFVCLSVCMSVRLSVCLSVSSSVCLSVCQSVRLSVCQSVRLSVCLYVSSSVCLSVSQFVCLSVCLFACLCQFVCLSVCLSVSQFIYLSVCQSVRRTICRSDCQSVCQCAGLSVCLSQCYSASLSACLSSYLSVLYQSLNHIFDKDCQRKELDGIPFN